MAASHLGPQTGRFAGQGNIRPFSASSTVVASTRPTVSVTAGRTAGVGRPTNGPTLLATATPIEMVSEAVGTALQSLKVLNRHALEVAESFRQGEVDIARRQLRDLVHGTESLVQLAALSAQVIGLDLCSLDGADGLRAESETRAVVDQLMAQLLSQDWPGAAKTLERDFLTALTLWRAVLDTVGGAAATGFSGPAA